MMKKIESNKKKIIIAALLILLSLVIFLGIRSVSSRIMRSESRAGKSELEKQKLAGKIEYLDRLLKNQTLEYTLIFDGTEESFRESILPEKAAKHDDSISAGEAAEIISILDSHVNEPVNFTINADGYLLVVYKDLIGGEVRYRDKYVLENSKGIDIYFEREVTAASTTASTAATKQGRLIYHWVKLLKIPCEISCEYNNEASSEPNSERNVVIHIIE
ncbi:MAG: hypothetical protein GXY17_05445 [Clostridiaceae bacterium]|jgi:hypothetical protein|nr:hypothetical protein [Clostridiaceae bacterium]